jgi:hypothetical protein
MYSSGWPVPLGRAAVLEHDADGEHDVELARADVGGQIAVYEGTDDELGAVELDVSAAEPRNWSRSGSRCCPT